MKIIGGEKVTSEETKPVAVTTVRIDRTTASMGSFDWKQEQKTDFTLVNTGNKPLIIHTINTSCGCTTVDFPKKPVRPGEEAVLHVSYKAEHEGYFNKTITVYCNVEFSPIKLKITGTGR